MHQLQTRRRLQARKLRRRGVGAANVGAPGLRLWRRSSTALRLGETRVTTIDARTASATTRRAHAAARRTAATARTSSRPAEPAAAHLPERARVAQRSSRPTRGGLGARTAHAARIATPRTARGITHRLRAARGHRQCCHHPHQSSGHVASPCSPNERQRRNLSREIQNKHCKCSQPRRFFESLRTAPPAGLLALTSV